MSPGLGGFPRGCVCPRRSSLGKQQECVYAQLGFCSPFHVPYLPGGSEFPGGRQAVAVIAVRAEAERSRLLAAGSPLCHCSNPAGRDALRARENEQSRVSTGILPLLEQLALHAAWNAVSSRLFPWQTSRPQLGAESLINLEYLALEHEDVASRTCCLVLSCSLGGVGSLCQAMAGPRDWHQ